MVAEVVGGESRAPGITPSQNTQIIKTVEDLLSYLESRRRVPLAEASSLVHTRETSSHAEDSPGYEVRTCPKCKREYRAKPKDGPLCSRCEKRLASEKLQRVLRDLGQDAAAEKVRECSEVVVYICADCGGPVARPRSCGHRLCPWCAAARADRQLKHYRKAADDMKQPKLLTLTVRSVDHISAGYYAWLRACFTKLRRRRWFQRLCVGGVYSIEATYGSSGWHVHLHALIDSDYIPQEALSEAWAEITGGSFVVDIRRVRGFDATDGLEEVVKYLAKAATFMDKPEAVLEFMAAVKGSRLVHAWGSMYGRDLDDDTVLLDDGTCYRQDEDGDWYRVERKFTDQGPAFDCPKCGKRDWLFFGWEPRELFDRVKGVLRPCAEGP